MFHGQPRNEMLLGHEYFAYTHSEIRSTERKKTENHLQSAIMYFSLSFTFVKDRIGKFFKMYFVNFFGCVHDM